MELSFSFLVYLEHIVNEHYTSVILSMQLGPWN